MKFEENGMSKDTIAAILTLWDSYTADMENIFSLLMDGKSELAAFLLKARIEIHNGQSRDHLIDRLTEVKDGI